MRPRRRGAVIVGEELAHTAGGLPGRSGESEPVSRLGHTTLFPNLIEILSRRAASACMLHEAYRAIGRTVLFIGAVIA